MGKLWDESYCFRYPKICRCSGLRSTRARRLFLSTLGARLSTFYRIGINPPYPASNMRSYNEKSKQYVARLKPLPLTFFFFIYYDSRISHHIRDSLYFNGWKLFSPVYIYIYVLKENHWHELRFLLPKEYSVDLCNLMDAFMLLPVTGTAEYTIHFCNGWKWANTGLCGSKDQSGSCCQIRNVVVNQLHWIHIYVMLYCCLLSCK